MKFRFLSYHPYSSFADEGKYFVLPNGRPSFPRTDSESDPEEMSDDESELWQLGKNAFSSLPKFENMEEFDDYYKEHLDGIEFIKEIIKEAVITRRIIFKNYDGKIIEPDFTDRRSSEVLDTYWQLALKTNLPCDYLMHHFLFACFEEIDSAIIGLRLDGGVVFAIIAAANTYANFQAIESGNDNLQKARSDLALRGAIERYRRDPKQAAKQLVKECWLEWQTRPERYGSQSKFANDVLTKIQVNESGDPIISFDTIVKKWIPAWTKGKK